VPTRKVYPKHRIFILNKLQTNTTSVHLQLNVRLTILAVVSDEENKEIAGIIGGVGGEQKIPRVSSAYNILYSIPRAGDTSIDNYRRQRESESHESATSK
jgi:hypothetical protein